VAIATRFGCERIVRFAFAYALAHGRKRVTLVHKANILKKASGLFLETGRAVAREYEGRIAFDDRIVDAMAMQLVVRPETFDVVVTTNLFGDILSDEIAGVVGGLGLTAGANIGHNSAIFEAVHGTAPDIAGKNVANPGALLLAACLMLDRIGEGESASRVRLAFEEIVREGKTLTRDVGGTASTSEFAAAIMARLRR
jgi:isocitrate dehydrogenase (NAD+)